MRGVLTIAGRELAAAFAAKLRPGGCFIDVQSRFDRAALEEAGLTVWRL